MNSVMEEEDEAPVLFRCPISMEPMCDPVTVSTGVTYERKHIERWLHVHNKTTCPATMQELETLDLTPNNTLKSLISSWHRRHRPPPSAADHDNLISILTALQSDPFKVTSLKRLQSAVENDARLQNDFVSSGGVQALAAVMAQALTEGADFASFRACEESLAVLRHLPTAAVLSIPGCVGPMMLVLRTGGAEARFNALTILLRMSAASRDWMCGDRAPGLAGPLLELLSDEVSARLGSASLDLLTEVVSASNKNRHEAIESGAVRVLVELLPDSSRHKCERVLLLLKRLCECPEGRSAFADHGLGVAAVSKKVLRVSELGTKLGVRVLWLVCSFSPRERVIDDMMVCGAVRKLIGLVHVDGRSSTKEKAVRMLAMHGVVWGRYACFPCELKEYVRLLHFHAR